MLTLYTRDYCPYCTKAKNLLSSIGASFEEIDITETPEIIMELAKKSKMRTVPQIFLDDISLGGYSDIEALHRAGKLKEILWL
jgi:glutaredoxin 3